MQLHPRLSLLGCVFQSCTLTQKVDCELLNLSCHKKKKGALHFVNEPYETAIELFSISLDRSVAVIITTKNDRTVIHTPKMIAPKP